jgi:hypothetical protein
MPGAPGSPVSATSVVVASTGTRLTTPIHLEMVRSRNAIQAMAAAATVTPSQPMKLPKSLRT